MTVSERRQDGHLRELIDEATRRKQTFVEIEAMYQTAARDLHRAVKAAVDAGATKACIARSLGVSRERVVAIVKQADRNI